MNPVTLTLAKDYVHSFVGVSVKDFGAKGDGITDDFAAIQTALDRIAQAGGGILHFPIGVYRVTQSLRVGDNTIITGVGPLSRIKLADGVNPNQEPVLTNADHDNGNSNIRVQDILVDANREGNPTGLMHAVFFHRCTNLDLVRVHGRGARGIPGGVGIVISAGSHILLNGCRGYENTRIGISTTANPNDVSLVGCVGSNNGEQGIHTSTGTGIAVVGCVADGNTTDGFDLTNATVTTFTGNTSRNNGRAGFNILGGYKIISGCYAYNNGQEGILLNPPGDSVSRIAISGCVLDSNGRSGIRIRKGYRISITGNVITGVPQGYDGLRVEELSTGGYTSGQIVVSSNIFYGGDLGINFMTEGYDNLVIVGNYAPKGIYVAGSPSNLVMANNLPESA